MHQKNSIEALSLQAQTWIKPIAQCRYYQQNDTCPLDDRCRFAHGEKDLQDTTVVGE